MNLKKRSAVILQARLDSSRLPRKALLPLAGKPVIFHVMRNLKKIPAALHILACPDDSFCLFKDIALSCGFKIFSGNKENVLNRYCAAARFFELDKINNFRVIRATGDNIFVNIKAACKINHEGDILGADYAAYAALPCGAGVESVSLAALLRAEAEAETDFQKEHVCPYLYEHGEKFKLHRPLAPRKWQNHALRLTLDTAEDYKRIQSLFGEG